MIQNSYTTSIISLSTGFSFNGYSYYSNERCPSSYCSCCCSFPPNSSKLTVPINPSYLYGLRQSSLIYWQPSRRLILGSGERYCCSSPVYDLGCHFCGDSCCIKQKRVDPQLGKCCKQKCCVNKKNVDNIRSRLNRRFPQCSALEDAEAMLSLLAEEPVEGCLDVRGRKRCAPIEGKFVPKQDFVSLNSRNRKGRKEDGGSLYPGRVQSVGEVHRKRYEEAKTPPKRESCSSYYSVSDSIDSESDSEVEAKYEDFERESSTSSGKDSEKVGHVVISGETKDSRRYVNEADNKHVQSSSKHDNFRLGSSAEWDCRKKSEKKLDEVSAGETKSKQDFVMGHSHLSQNLESSSTKTSSSRKQHNYEERKSTSDEQKFSSGVQMHGLSAGETKSKEDFVQGHSRLSQNHESSSLKASSSRRRHDYEDGKSTSDEQKFSSGVHMHGLSAGESKSKEDFVLGHSCLSQNIDSSSTKASSSRKQHNYEEWKSTSDEHKFSSGVHLHGLSAGETKSNEDFVQGHSRLFQNNESSSMKASSSRQQHKYDERTSTSGGHHLHGMSGAHTKVDNQASGYSEYGNTHEQLTQTKGNYGGSSTWMISDAGTSTWRTNEGKDGVMVVGESVEGGHCKECGATMEQKNTQSRIQQHPKLSEIHDEPRLTVVGQGQSESRLGKKEKGLTSLQTSVKEGTNKHGQVNIGGSTQQYSETMDFHGNYVGSTSKSSQQKETRMQKLEGNSSSFISIQEVKGQVEGSSGKAIKEAESSKVKQAGLGVSQVFPITKEIGRGSGSKQQVYDAQIYSASRVKSVEEVVEKHQQIEGTTAQSTFRTENQGHILQAGFTGNSSEMTNITQSSVTVISQTGFPQPSEGEGKGNLQISVVSPPYQIIERPTTHVEPSTNIVRKDYAEASEEGTSTAYMHPQARIEHQITSSLDEANASDSKPYEESSGMDIMGSATRMEESSIKIYSEFMEKIKHEGSQTDATVEKKSSEVDSNSQDEKVVKETTQRDSKKTKSKKRHSRRSSGSSGTKGPPDEMWDVKDHFSQEPSEMGSLEGGTISETVVPKRTGKSLWNAVSGIFQLRWGSHSETHNKSPVKSGGQNSPRESASGGGAWFSGNEQDEVYSDCLTTEHANMSQEPSSSDQVTLHRKGSNEQKEDLGVLSEGISTKANNSNVSQQTPQSDPAQNVSASPARRLRRLYAFEEIEDEAGQDVGVNISTTEQKEPTKDVGQTSVSSDVEMKGMKLERSKQVLHDRYDEWEDAYKHENEQRKVDEIFMREALVEANKAASNWEVPVGAVLVQNGNIIGRGYNLVEELRDSTAHAEMICIREASNALRTWRLSETTLYVTLEPCPMCAGAILQARIGTLVWGAPNKLLGADGSWIRLFSEGGEEERPDVGDKPAAPVHPFHPKMKIRRGVLEAECAGIMQQFFQLRRKKEEKKSEEPAQQPSCLPVPVPHHPSKLLNKMHNLFHFMFCL